MLDGGWVGAPGLPLKGGKDFGFPAIQLYTFNSEL